MSAAEVTSSGVLVMRMDDAKRGIDRSRQCKWLELDRELLEGGVIGFAIDFVDAGALVMMSDDAARD